MNGSDSLDPMSYDRVLIPGEGAYEDRDPDMPFVFRDEARKSLRYLPERDDERYPEVFVWDHFNPETLGCFATPLPDGVLGAYREAMPEFARRPDLYRVGFHPVWKRVCLFQKLRTRDNSSDVWGVAFTFVGPVPLDEKGNPKLPDDLRDLNHDGRYDSFVGNMGEFYAPTLRADWLELLELADNQKQRVRGERARLIASHRESRNIQRDLDIANRRHDAIVYHRHRFTAAANERDGCMQGLPIVGTENFPALIAAKEAATHDVTISEHGYRIKTKKAPNLSDHTRFPRGLDRMLPEIRRVDHQDARVMALLDGLGSKGGHKTPSSVARQKIPGRTL